MLGATNAAVTPFGHNVAEFKRLMGYFSTTKVPASRMLDESDSVLPQAVSDPLVLTPGNGYQLVQCDNVGRCPDGVVRTRCKW